MPSVMRVQCGNGAPFGQFNLPHSYVLLTPLRLYGTFLRDHHPAFFRGVVRSPLAYQRLDEKLAIGITEKTSKNSVVLFEGDV